jgi:hypothetical protein
MPVGHLCADNQPLLLSFIGDRNLPARRMALSCVVFVVF